VSRLPAQVTREERGDRVRYTWRRQDATDALLFVPACLFVDVLVGLTFSSTPHAKLTAVIIGLLALMGLMAAWLNYFALADVLNRGVLELDREGVRAWQEPLPWPGAARVARAQMRRVYVHHHRPAKGPDWFELGYVDAAGASRALVPSLRLQIEADYLCEELEALLELPGPSA
jgi:hypothetical protein